MCRAVVGAASTCLNVYPSTLFHESRFVHVTKQKQWGPGSSPGPHYSRISRVAQTANRIVGFISDFVDTQHVRGASDARRHTGNDHELITDVR